MAHLQASFLQSKQSQAQPAGQGAGKPHVDDMAVFNSKYVGSSGICSPRVKFVNESWVISYKKAPSLYHANLCRGVHSKR